MTRCLGACWRVGLLAGLLLSTRAGAAQTRPAPDTVDTASEGVGPPCPAPQPPRRRVGFVISLDNRESFVQSSAVTIVGLNAGVVLPGRRWRLGLGGYTLRRDYAALYVYQYKNGKRTKKAPDTLTPQLDLTYLTPNVSYVFFQRPWLEISLPLEVGLGRSHYAVTDQTGKTTTDSRGLFVPVEAGLSVLLKPVRWVGVSGSVGYRKSVFEIDYKDDFDGMYFSYRLNVFVGVIWRDLRQHRQSRRFARELADARRGRFGRSSAKRCFAAPCADSPVLAAVVRSGASQPRAPTPRFWPHGAAKHRFALLLFGLPLHSASCRFAVPSAATFSPASLCPLRPPFFVLQAANGRVRWGCW